MNEIAISYNYKSIQNAMDLFTQTYFFQSSAYTKSALNYRKEICLSIGNKIEDKTFVITINQEPVILFLGTKIYGNNVNLNSFNGRPCFSIENKDKLTVNAIKIFIKEFELIKDDNNGNIWYRDFLNRGELSILSRHLLLNNAKPNPVFTHVVDLNVDESLLKRNIRKSYKSLVNWGVRELQPQVFNSSNITWDKMEQFRKLHIRESGRETRSEKSWEKQYEMVKTGEAFVVLGHFNNELVSAGLFMHNKMICYYGVSASRRDLFEKPLFHGLLWTALLNTKKIGCRWFETGEQLFPNLSVDVPPTNKELGISKFKSGFGGDTHMFLDLRLSNSGI